MITHKDGICKNLKKSEWNITYYNLIFDTSISLVMVELNETIRAVIKEFHQCVLCLMKKLDRIIPEPYKYSITIMDIPEEIMRYIFSFLSDAELIILVRNTCRWFQFIIDKYVKIGICVRDIIYALFQTI